MKKLLLVLPVFIAFSCVKEYNCECTDRDENGDIVDESTIVIESKNFEEAEATCLEENGTYTIYTRKCIMEDF